MIPPFRGLPLATLAFLALVATPVAAQVTTTHGASFATCDTSAITKQPCVLRGDTWQLLPMTPGVDYVAPGGALGTPSSGNAGNLTNIPAAGLTGLGTGVARALVQPLFGTGSSGLLAFGSPSTGLSYTAPYSGATPISQAVKNQAQPLSPREWGADPTCATDSTNALNAYFAVMGPGTRLDLGRDCYLVGNLSVPANVTITGPNWHPDILVQANGGITVNPYTWGGQLRTQSGTTITVGNGFRMTGVLLIHSGLLSGSLPATTNAQATTLLSQFADTAITAPQGSAFIDHNIILGYNYAIYATNGGGASISSRLYVMNNMIDAKNGIYYSDSGDTGHVAFNHIFPFLTAAIPGISLTNQSRSGACIDFENSDTSSTVMDNLCFGYAYGFNTQNASLSSIALLRNRFESPGGSTPMVGITLLGQYMDASLNYIIGYPLPVKLNATNTATGSPFAAGEDNIKFVDNTVIGTSGGGGECLDLYAGYATITGNLFQNCYNGVQLEAGASGGIIKNNRFVSISNEPIYNNGSTSYFIERLSRNPWDGSCKCASRWNL